MDSGALGRPPHPAQFRRIAADLTRLAFRLINRVDQNAPTPHIASYEAAPICPTRIFTLKTMLIIEIAQNRR